jgi:hypothetical protein
MKLHAREKEAADERKVEEQRKAGTLGMSKSMPSLGARSGKIASWLLRRAAHAQRRRL